MRSATLEPGILRLFRLFLMVQLVLILGNVLAHSHRGMLIGCPWCAVLFGGVNILLLLGYLSWPKLQKHLAGFYLPIALIYAATFSLVIQNLFLGVRTGAGTVSSEETAWQLFLFLFIPLVLIAWQYNFKAVIAYCLFTALLDYALMACGRADFNLFANTYHRLLFIRAVAFLVTGYVIAHIMTQFRQQRAARELANRELMHYAATLEQLTISRERNRMARELHDTLAHTLSGIAVQLEAVQSLWQESPDEARSMLEKSLIFTRSGLAETRRALHDLRASPLEDMGLELALRTLAAETSQRAGLELTWQVQSPLPKLSANVEQGIYRIAQEALENIVRHSAARSICLDCTTQPESLVLSIEDDGKGFAHEALEDNQHFGLRGMQERARMMNSELDISSQPGQGTKLQLKVKIRNGH